MSDICATIRRNRNALRYSPWAGSRARRDFQKHEEQAARVAIVERSYNEKELVVERLDTAIYRRKPNSVVHHSDQGSQYTSIAFGKRCKEAGIQSSIGSVGDCYDKAMCECFNATLESELLAKHRFKTQREASLAISDFIEAWRNPHRRHCALGYISPIDYELRMAKRRSVKALTLYETYPTSLRLISV